MTCHYIVFARFPEQGKVKTRLASTLGEQKTLHLYSAMLQDTLEIVQSRTSATNADVLLFVSPPDSLEQFSAWLPQHNLDYPHIYLFPQTGTTLGDRMENAFRVADERRSLPALIIGSDSPTLPEQIFTEAEQALEHHSAVLGKSMDGGFYLMGLPWITPDIQALFLGDRYSHPAVFEQTAEVLEKLYGKVHYLPPWYDIDEVSDLERLKGEIAHDYSGLRYFHTTSVIASWK